MNTELFHRILCLFTRQLSLLLICLLQTDGQAELSRVVDYICYHIGNDLSVHNVCNNSTHVSDIACTNAFNYAAVVS